MSCTFQTFNFPEMCMIHNIRILMNFSIHNWHLNEVADLIPLFHLSLSSSFPFPSMCPSSCEPKNYYEASEIKAKISKNTFFTEHLSYKQLASGIHNDGFKKLQRNSSRVRKMYLTRSLATTTCWWLFIWEYEWSY